MIVGLRGVGKTYGAKKRAIKDAIKNGNEFIYLRRYKTELAPARSTFFADILKEFPNIDFRINGDKAQWADPWTRAEKKREWKTIGYFIALSQSQNYKSVSYVNVKTIIFDEFIIEKVATTYLPNEANIFVNFFNTVDRSQDKTKVYMLANSVSIMNPYFNKWGIMPDDIKKEFIIKKYDGVTFIAVHFPEAEDFQNEVYETKFGKFIKGTEYAEYAVGNTFSDNTKAMLGLKDSKARPMFILETDTGMFSIWYNFMDNYYYIQKKLPKDIPVFTLVSYKMDNDKRLMTFSDRPISNLRTAFRRGNMSFDVPETRNTFTEIFKR